MRILTIALVAIILSANSFAEETEKYVEAAKKYVAKHSTKEKDAAWEKHWKNLLETASKDKDEDEESFSKRYIYDWMADRKAKLVKNELTIDDKLVACRVYLIFKNKGYNIPGLISDHLTADNLEKFMSDDQVIVAEKKDDKKEEKKR